MIVLYFDSILKINTACFNTNLFSLGYEPWHIWNPDIFMIRGMFRALEIAKVRRYLHDVFTFDVFFYLSLIYAKCSIQSCLFVQCCPWIFLVQSQESLYNVGTAFAATGYYQKINRSKTKIAEKWCYADDNALACTILSGVSWVTLHMVFTCVMLSQQN